MTVEAKIEVLIILLFPSAQNTKNFHFEENAHLMEALGITKNIPCDELLEKTIGENLRLKEENHELRKWSPYSLFSSLRKF